MTQRDWQKDMELCEAATAAPWTWYQVGTYQDGELGNLNAYDTGKTVVMGNPRTLNHSAWMREEDKEFLINARTALPYWLQEAKFYQGELSDCYKAVEQQQEEIRELTLAKYREIERADAAEARVKELENSARFELIRHIRTEADRKEYLLAEEIIRLEEREKQLKEESSEAIEGLYQIIQRGDLTSLDLDQAEEVYKRFRSTLYPDTPAPKEVDNEN